MRSKPPVMVSLGDGVMVPLDWLINCFGTMIREQIDEGEMVDRWPTFTYGEYHPDQD